MKGEEREIGRASCYQEAWYIISEFLFDHKFTSHYQRIWKEDESTSRYVIDVGSHTEFFIIDSGGIDLMNGGK
jgi:hypothetical protein